MKNLDLGKNENSSKGITLVALVISIIVLLILATVSIQTLTGNNGLLTKTEIAVQSNKDSQEEEKVKLAVAAAQLDGNGTISTQNLGNELKANFDIDSVDLNEKSGGWLFKINKEYTIYKDGKIEVRNLLLLPKEYQQVEYIEGTGTQWIDTKYSPVNNTNMEIEFEYLGSAGGNWIAISGLRSGKSTIIFWFHGGKIKPTVEYAGYDPELNTDFPIIEKGSRHIYKNIGGDFYMDGVKYASTTNVLVENNKSIYIFAFNNNGTLDNRHPYVRIFKYRLIDVKISRDYIPCYSTTTVTNVDGVQVPANTKGLYDLIEGKFYTNQGSGDDFIAGPDV